MKKKLIIRGVLILISVMGVIAYLVFQGIFIPNKRGRCRILSREDRLERVGKAKYEVCVYKGY